MSILPRWNGLWKQSLVIGYWSDMGSASCNLIQEPIPLMFFTHNSNLMANPFRHNFILGYQITTNFCTCHNSTAVVTCAKFCCDYFNTYLDESEMNFPMNLNHYGLKKLSETGPCSTWVTTTNILPEMVAQLIRLQVLYCLEAAPDLY